MNERLQKAYLNLINSLLNCPSGEEAQILNANGDLVDAGLVQTMEQVASVLAEQGNPNAANFLRNIAAQLATAMGISSKAATPKAYLHFLGQVLQATSDSNGDPRQVYPLLEANLDKLNDTFAFILRGVVERILPTSEEKYTLAAAIGNFSNLIQKFDQGSKSSNLEIAITGYESVLPLYSREAFPQLWAIVRYGLGNAYVNRVSNEREQDLERAIDYYQNALQVYTRTAYREIWSKIQHNLAVAYMERIYEDKVENLLRAIECLENTLQVRTSPKDWADTQHELAIAYKQLAFTYLDRSRHDWTDSRYKVPLDKADPHQKLALTYFQNALQVYTPQDFPQDWGRTQMNLGGTYLERWEENQAITCFQNALQVYTPTNFPQEWATTQINLGIAYVQQGKREQAVACFENALQVFKRKDFPEKIGIILLHLAKAHSKPWEQNIPQNIPVAIQACKSALEIFTPTSFPYYCLETGWQLGLAAGKAGLFSVAIQGYAAAIDAIEQNYTWTTSESRRREFMEANIAVYQNMVQVCIFNGQLDLAIEYVERSKARNLVKLLATRDHYPKKVNPISFREIQALVDERTAILEWHITTRAFETFIITRQSPGIKVWQSAPEDRQPLTDRIKEYLSHSQDASNLQKQLPDLLKALAEILHIDEILELVPDNCDQIILVPHRFLHLLPLHAMTLANGSCFIDRFPKGVRYAPSCQLLQLSQNWERPNFSHLFAIQDPQQNLPYANLEVETLKRAFASFQVLAKADATKEVFTQAAAENLRSAHCLHFACHGKFNSQLPLESHLKLTDNFLLTLGEIFKLDLSQCRLVTLSACETGLIDLESSITDEYICLPSGFLYAGSLSVISSLWEVNSISTTFLMIKFYEILKKQQRQGMIDVAIALNQAQKWLRDLTSEEFEQILTKFQHQINQVLAQIPEGERPVAEASIRKIRKRQPRPFAHPYYWAAFTATGR